MMRTEYILQTFHSLPAKQQVDLLLKALELMKEDNTRSTATCIGLAIGLPKDPQVSSIEEVDDYNIVVLFDNGEYRKIDFKGLFDGSKKFHKQLLEDHETFLTVEVAEGTLAWKSLGHWTEDLDGNRVFHYFDIDPGLLYEHSTLIQNTRQQKTVS